MSNRKLNKLIIPLVIIIIGGIGTMSYVFRSPENSVKNESAIYSLSSDDLYTAFNDNEATANEKYLGKIIDVTGEVTEIQKTNNGQLILLLSCNSPLGGVRCTFETQQEKLLQKVTKGTKHSIKGKCSGFLAEVVLDNCCLLN